MIDESVEKGDENVEFWKVLGGVKGPIKSAKEAASDTLVTSSKALFRLSDATGKMEFTKVGGDISRKSLDSKDVFVFDAGMEVYVWLGKGASKEEKRAGLQYAKDYLVKFNRPIYLPISRVNEEGEPETMLSSLAA